ncbi:MAG: ACP S-malonyltransferase [Gammaproteobacteria bacterium]
MNTFKNNQTLGFIFPGQGSQAVGMLAGLAQAFPVVKETFASASVVLAYDLWQLVQQGPAEELNRTDRTQPAMLAAGVAVWRVWNEKGGAMPCVMAGHSLGEYTALVCAGALDFATAIRLVAERGRFMQEAVPSGEGAMAAILGLADDAVQALCSNVADDQVLAAVNFNSPGQVVIAGHAPAVERAIAAAKAAGAKRAIKLPVSVPSHCRLMEPAAERMAKLLETVDIRAPEIPVINNVDVAVEEDSQRIKEALLRQLYSPVRWVETIQAMAARGVSTVVECGPGKVLAGLNRRIDRDMKALPVFDPATLEAALTSE